MNDSNRQPVRWLCPCVLWCLVGVVALQSYGLATWTRRGETPIFGLLYFDWDWSTEAVDRVDEASILALTASAVVLPIAALLLLHGRWAVLRVPGGALVVLIAAASCGWQLAMACAKWWRDTPFYPEFNWGAWEVVFMELNIILEQSVRYLAPLALIVLLPNCGDTPRWRVAVGTWLLRLAAATTFFGHGYEAFRGNPQFADLLIAASQNLLQLTLSESLARQMLVVIGIHDFVLAALILTTRWRWVAGYMAFWGCITAASRMVQFGVNAYPEVLIRTANFGVPWALLLHWWTTASQSAPRDAGK